MCVGVSMDVRVYVHVCMCVRVCCVLCELCALGVRGGVCVCACVSVRARLCVCVCLCACV